MSRTYRATRRGSRQWDRSCRNHGSCPWCQRGRRYRNEKRKPADYDDEVKL